MKAGVAKTGMRVRYVGDVEVYPELRGTHGTVTEVVAQHPGAEDDALLYQPENSSFNYPAQASDLEEVTD